MKWIISFLLMVITSSAYAEPKFWMKQDNPIELGFFVIVAEECAFTKRELEVPLKAEFGLRGVKPTLETKLNLTVKVKCQSIIRNDALIGYVVYPDVRYGTQMDYGPFVLYESADYGELIVASKDSNEYVISVIHQMVRSALIDYVKANMDIEDT